LPKGTHSMLGLLRGCAESVGCMLVSSFAFN